MLLRNAAKFNQCLQETLVFCRNMLSCINYYRAHEGNTICNLWNEIKLAQHYWQYYYAVDS